MIRHNYYIPTVVASTVLTVVGSTITNSVVVSVISNRIEIAVNMVLPTARELAHTHTHT